MSGANADSFVRLRWAERGTNFSPIPDGALSHVVTSAELDDAVRARSRALIFEHRCLACHPSSSQPAGIRPPELGMDAPSFDGIGARRRAAWMMQWILDPRSLRPSARMPTLLHGAGAKTEAAAMAAFLATLKTPASETASAAYQTRQKILSKRNSVPAAAASRPLYDRLHCGACHDFSNDHGLRSGLVSLRNVRSKFSAGALARYLLAPEAGYAWTRMPNFHLSAAEADELAETLEKQSDAPMPDPAPGDSAMIDSGRRLVYSSGCLRCHIMATHSQPASYSVLQLDTIASSPSEKVLAGSCLGPAPYADFGFSSEERAALTQFLRGDRTSLQRHVPAEYAARQADVLRCATCHGQIELVPPLDGLGDKLKPEWTSRLLAGKLAHKIRFDNHPGGDPWLEARMPAFAVRAEALAQGFAARDGWPSVTPPEPPIDDALAAAGRVLLGKDGGFSCVTCHALGSQFALEVFESEGVNLAWSAERLRRDYYHRWVRNPLAVDPKTKMPVYFDEEGASPLTEILNGNGDAQADAIWNFLRQSAAHADAR